MAVLAFKHPVDTEHEHRVEVLKDAIEQFMAAGFDTEQATWIVTAIALGEIPSVSITY